MTFLFSNLDYFHDSDFFHDNVRLNHTINILQKTTQIKNKGHQGGPVTKHPIVKGKFILRSDFRHLGEFNV